MNKFGVVLGVAAVVTLAGCKDPDCAAGNADAVQNEVKNVETVEKTETVETQASEPKCTCKPGTVHSSPCTCGAADCTCKVDASAGQKTTDYVVKGGDSLSRISKRFNVTVASIRALNPSLKGNVIRVGQVLKLPGDVDVGVQTKPAKKATVIKASRKAPAPYTGATKEYVVKSGDTLGAIAYSNGVTIRQLKSLNGLQKDTLKIGQKLKIPAEKVKTAKAAAPKASASKAKPAKKAAPAPAAPAPVAEPAPAPAAEAAAPAPVDAPAPAVESAAPASVDAPAPAPAAEPAAPAAAAPAPAAATMTYVVQEGDDMTGVSIRWGVSAAEIRELNNLSENDQLVPGQIIKLPADAQQ